MTTTSQDLFKSAISIVDDVCVPPHAKMSFSFPVKRLHKTPLLRRDSDTSQARSRSGLRYKPLLACWSFFNAEKVLPLLVGPR